MDENTSFPIPGTNGSEPANDSNEKKKEEEKKVSGKKLAARLTMALTGFVVVSVTATEMMMFLMFGRNTPLEDKPFALYDWAAENSYAWNALEFFSGSNRLKGYIISPRSPKALMVIVHGIKADSDSMEPVVQYFVLRGYAVATFDGTASGRSEGKKTVGLQQQRLDLRALLDYLDEQRLYTDLPLVLFGHSAGAYGVAAEAQDTRACAAVCVSGFETPLETMRFWAAQYTGPLSSIEYPFLLIREFIAKGGDANTAASDALKRSGIPAIVVQGEDDDVVKEDISLYAAVQKNGSGLISLVHIDNPKHRGHSDILVAEDELNTELLDLIANQLEMIIQERK